MVRLTERDERGNASLIGVDTARLAGLGANTLFKILAALNCLAAYEDTGLDPAGVAALQTHWDHAYADYVKNMWQKIGGMERMEELAKADSEGRLIILPVVPGDELTRNGKVYRAASWTVLLSAFSEDEGIILDVEEAAAALKAQKGADNARNYIPWEAD